MSNPPKAMPAQQKGNWLLGNADDLKKDPLNFLVKSHKENGDCVAMRIGTFPMLFITDPDLIHEVLVTKATIFTKDVAIKNNPEFFGNGLLRSEGELWKRQRKLASPAFSPKRLEEYSKVMVEHTEKRVASWKDGANIDINREMMRLTLSIAAKTLFDADQQDDEEFEEALHDAQKYLAERLDDFILLMLPDWVPFPANVHLHEAIQKIDKVVYKLINERRGKTEGRNDLLSSLMAVQDDDGSKMSDQQVRDEVFTLFFAGHETTALTMTWTLLLLAQHPEVEAKLLEEIKTVLGDRQPVGHDTHSLNYARKVVMESMRVLPPVWGLGREASEDTTIGPYDVPKGTSILISQWVNNKDERWFPNPEKFDPDRWTTEFNEKLPKYAFFPFGGGPRTCIGNNFALMEAVLLLVIIMKNYHLELDTTHKVEYQPGVTLKPKTGVKVILHKR
ncbi:MAG: cytochrome P450 [Candidatus Obscuribacterales bacterium]|nr:cytochrome P450 [Candidatus Obscuribacterales bacterium]